MHHPKTVAKRCREKPGPRRCANQSEFRKIQTDGSGRGTLADHDINRKILHCRIEYLLHLTVQTMNLIHKKDISLLKVIQNGRHLSGFLDCRSGGHLHMSSHLIGNDSGQSSLTQTRRTVKKDVIQCIMPLFGSFYIYFECILGFFLTNVFIKSLRTEASLQRQILLCHICCDHSFFHLYHRSIVYCCKPCHYSCFRAAFRIASTSPGSTSVTLCTAFSASELLYPRAVNASTAS